MLLSAERHAHVLSAIENRLIERPVADFAQQLAIKDGRGRVNLLHFFDIGRNQFRRVTPIQTVPIKAAFDRRSAAIILPDDSEAESFVIWDWGLV